MLYIAALSVIALIVLAALLWDSEQVTVTEPHVANQGEPLEYETVINDIYLVQRTPYLGPPPPAARLEPEQNRIYIDEC